MGDFKTEPSFHEAMRAMHLKSFQEKRKKYGMLNQAAKKGQTVFVGSSLMEFFPIEEMQLALNMDRIIYNRGIAGATTADLLEAMDACIFDLSPSKIFINIGSNDIGSVGGAFNLDKMISNYNKIMGSINARLPDCAVFMMAYYPVNPNADFGLDKHQKDQMFATRSNENIRKANAAVALLAKEHGVRFIDANEGLLDRDGNLKKEYSVDGIHLWPNAYVVILRNICQYL